MFHYQFLGCSGYTFGCRVAAEQVQSGCTNRRGRRAASLADWIFPAETKSGHIEAATLKKQHEKALAASKVPAFVPYDLRHTCLTRWAKVMDPFTLKKLAGHADLNTTMRYVHLNDADVRAAMEKVQGGHKNGHNADLTDSEQPAESAVNNRSAVI